MRSITWKRLLGTAIVTGALAAGATISASACTTLYVGGNLTEEGTPFVARTEDYGSDMNKLWFVCDAGKWKEGDTYTSCSTYGGMTWTFTHDSYRFTHFTNDIYYDGICPECGKSVLTGKPSDFHFSYTEFGTNEKGVSVSATESIGGNKAVQEIDPLEDGGIEETDIPTIILAEADSARDGVELLCEIYANEDYGAHYESGLFICDQNETWYIENCTGHQYLAVKLNDNMIFIEPNISILGEIDLDDTENVIASSKLIEVAKEADSFVGREEDNVINFKASYATNSPGNARMPDGLIFLNEEKYGDYSSEDLKEHNELFTISNVKDGEIVSLYTDITAAKDKLNKNDVFNFYKLSSVGKSSNQEIEIFQLFKNAPVETGTVGWVGVGNMSYNVFVPYYPMLLKDSKDLYKGYQVSTAEVQKVTEKPDGFATYGQNRRTGQAYYVEYPENWRDSYYFTFEGLGGYIQYAEQLTGTAVSDADKAYVSAELDALQQQFIQEFEAAALSDSVKTSASMAQRAHEKGLALIDYLSDDSSSSDSSSASSSSDSDDDDDEYTVTGSSAQNGSVSVNLKNASQGSTVTITVKPETGYTVETVTVTDKNGKDVEVTSKGDNKYTFTMPSGNVTVGATFMEDNTMLNYFTDVPASAYYYDAVLWAVEKGITSGTSATAFSPSASCTRAQMVTFLWRAAGSPATAASFALPFTDVDPDAYYAEAIRWAVNQGITSGTSDTTFSPDATVTRGQTMTFLWRSLNSPVVNYAMDFTDVAADTYYGEAVRWAVSEGVTSGTGNALFSPDADCTRGQIATFLYQANQ